MEKPTRYAIGFYVSDATHVCHQIGAQRKKIPCCNQRIILQNYLGSHFAYPVPKRILNPKPGRFAMTTDPSPSELTLRDVLGQIDRRLTLIEKDQRDQNAKFDTHEQRMDRRFEVLEQKIETSEQKIDGRFETFEQKIDGKFEAFRQEINERFDGFRREMNERFDGFRREIHAEFAEFRRESNNRFYWLLGLFFAGWVSLVTMMGGIWLKL